MRGDYEQTAYCVAGTTVPAFVERRTLSNNAPPHVNGVAGTTVPAFVERSRLGLRPAIPSCVAGTTVPAFVERWLRRQARRPSVQQCRRDYGPGLR